MYNVATMKKHPIRLLIVVVLLGWAFDFLFWGKSIGINFAIFTLACLLACFLLLLSNGLKPALQSLWLFAPCVFFAIITFVRREPLTLALAYTFTLFAMGLLAVTYRGGRWVQYGLSDYFNKFLQLSTGIFYRPILFLSQLRKERSELGETRMRLPVWPIVRGLLIALPVVVCFGSLLASADLVFNQKILDFIGLFDADRIIETIFRIINILFWAYLLAGVYLYTAVLSQDEKLLGEDKPLVKPFLGFTEAAIVLGSVAVLFLSFVIVQFRYFFGGKVNIGIEGFTYSQYARSGFNELVTVAFFSLILTLGLSTITRRENPVHRRAFSGLSVAILALVLVILTSAYQRLSLAIDWHGFSRLRLYPRVFLIWVGILFVAVVVLEIFRRERHFALAAVLASLGFAVSLSLVNVDAAIVRQNVLRATQGRHFNASYLASLSSDEVPALVEEFMDASLPTPTHEGVGAALLCYLHSASNSNQSTRDWRSWDYSLWAASRELEQAQTQLHEYRVYDVKWPVRVRTPGNVVYESVD